MIIQFNRVVKNSRAKELYERGGLLKMLLSETSM